MKKFVSILFAIALAVMPLALVGCGRKMKLIETTLPAQYKFSVNYKYWENDELKTNKTYTLIHGKANVLGDGLRNVYYLEEVDNIDTSYHFITIAITPDENEIKLDNLASSASLIKYWHEEYESWENYPSRDNFVSGINETIEKISAPLYELWDSDITDETNDYIVYNHYNYEIIKFAKNQYNYVLQKDGIFTHNAYRYTLESIDVNYDLADHLSDIAHRSALPIA